MGPARIDGFAGRVAALLGSQLFRSSSSSDTRASLGDRQQSKRLSMGVFGFLVVLRHWSS
jgi:hypothetical protein